MEVDGTEDARATLARALGLHGHELVAFVGAGGKTSALQRLALGLAEDGDTVAVTTTTAMFAAQLASLGPLVLMSDGAAPLATRVKQELLRNRVVAMAGLVGDDGKARGLSPAAVDDLWRQRIADSVVVEADGSRGLPLKSFGAAEPQLPSEATTVVVVAGLDALGSPLDEAHVHRARLLRSALSVAEDEVVTPRLFARALALQVARVRSLNPRAGIVALLNKADTDQEAAAGLEVARVLDGLCDGGEGRHAAAGRPDRLVLGSVAQGVFRLVTAERV